MKLKQSLKDKKFVKTHGRNQIINLPKEEKVYIDILIEKLLDEDNCQLIFRGDSMKSAFKNSGIERCYSNENDEFKFSKHGESIFFIGSKANSYLFKTDEVDFPIELDGTKDELFKGIYEEFKQNIQHSTFENEAKFKEYFVNKDSSHFCEIIKPLDEKDKIAIKYYYLWLLHVIGETKYKCYSNFLSTTKDYNIAKKFGKKEIVYVGWVPRPIKERCVYLGSLIQARQRLESLGLPVYMDEPYPTEDEISLIGGFYPHYTLGIYNIPKKEFLINDHLLDKKMLNMINEGLSEMIIKHGIGIDQSNFERSKFLEISAYKRYNIHIKGKGYFDKELH